MKKRQNQHFFFFNGPIRFISLCLLLLCLRIHVAAQKTPVKYAADTANINRLTKSADKKLTPDSAIVLFDSAFQLSKNAGYADGAFRALMTKGIKYYEKQDFVQFRNCCFDALPWAKDAARKDATAWCDNNIGVSYNSEGDYTKAAEYYYKALQELNKSTTEPTSTAVNIYAAIGEVNLALSQPDTALVYYTKAENVARKGNFYFQLAQILSIKGDRYLNQRQYDSAQKYYNETLEIGKKTGKVDVQAMAFEKLAQRYIYIADYPKAISCYKTAISLAQNRFDYLVLDATYGLGDAFYHQQHYQEAAALIESVLKQSKAHNAKDNYIDCYTKLTDIYRASGQYKKALDCMDSSSALKDSLNSLEKTKALKLMEVKYKTAEKDKEIAQNQLLIARQKNNITQKNIWIASIMAGVFLLGLLLWFLYRNTLHKERLQAEQIKILQKENTIGILKGVVQGEENERSRLARELHDGIGGILSAAMMRFMTIRHDNATITKIPAYTEGMQLLDEAADEIRKTAHNLMPDVLMKQTLPEAVRAYCSSVQEGSDLQIDFQCYGTFDGLTQDFKLNVYRIIQELLKNIIGHAQATKALVQLIMHEHALAITVEDNGIGFNMSEIKKGIGLRNMQTRVSSMEGQFTLESQMGKGTTVYIETPGPSR